MMLQIQEDFVKMADKMFEYMIEFGENVWQVRSMLVDENFGHFIQLALNMNDLDKA